MGVCHLSLEENPASKCDVVITGDHAKAMCFDQRFYVEASWYKDQVKQAGSLNSFPIPESIKQFRKNLLSGDQEAYPLYIRLQDPNCPFHY